MTTPQPRLSYFHRGGSTPLIGRTIGDYVREVAMRHAERDAVVAIPQGVRLSYGELLDRVDELARGLLSLGVERGDRVGIWSTDNVEWILLQLATARVGAVLVNVNPAYRVAELEHALRAARVQHLFLIPAFKSSRYVDMVRELCPEVARLDTEQLRCERFPELRRLVIYDPDDEHVLRPEPGFLTLAELRERGSGTPLDEVQQRSAELDPDDPINIQFTSGTTGFPKPVVLTHHNILNNGFFVAEAMRFTCADRLCVPLPFYHCFGMVVSNLGCLTHGAAVVIPAPHFDAGATLDAIDRERCTAVHGVPTMFVEQLEQSDFDDYDLSSLRTGIMAGAPCPPELMERVVSRMGCRELLIGYGQTEASPVTHLTRPEDSTERRYRTVGTNLPHQEVKIVDTETGAMVPIGARGEVCFRGYHVMRGYFEREEATAEAIDERGWLHSGDIGTLDEDGYLAITGRLKNMIIRGGENIYPAEIEAFFSTNPEIAQIAVFGLPDPRMGEEVAAWVQLHRGSSASAEDIREWARGRIAHYKIPRYLWLVEEFPMTVTGKIQKFRMREIASEWLEQETGEGDEPRELSVPSVRG